MKAIIVFVDKTARTHDRLECGTLKGAKQIAKDYIARMTSAGIRVDMEIVDKNTIFLESSY